MSIIFLLTVPTVDPTAESTDATLGTYCNA